MFWLGPGDDLLLATPRDTVVANTVASMHRKQAETPVNTATLSQPNYSDLSSGWTCLNCVPEGHAKYVVDMQTYFTYMRVP